MEHFDGTLKHHDRAVGRCDRPKKYSGKTVVSCMDQWGIVMGQ